MERLTSKYWRNLDPWEMCGQDNYCKRGCHEQGGCTKGCIVPRIYARLAAYEDTGMEPEDLKKAFNAGAILKLAAHALNTTPDHIRDLLQAEQDGLLVALPCKVGDKVYQIDAERVYESEVKGIIYDAGHIDFDERAIGKTVFLTREEAEAALKGGDLPENRTD